MLNAEIGGNMMIKTNINSNIKHVCLYSYILFTLILLNKPNNEHLCKGTGSENPRVIQIGCLT